MHETFASDTATSAECMPDGDSDVGIVGTFDVENYGDLLFPLTAKAAIKARRSDLGIVAFSPTAKAQGWPFPVRATSDIPVLMHRLAAMLVGGGQIIRFDPGYPVPVPPDVPMPIACWLLPALQAGMAGRPVFWNAPGVWIDTPRAPWFDETFRTVLRTGHIRVRDQVSKAFLSQVAPDAQIDLLPDTAFSLARLWPRKSETPSFTEWRQSAGLDRPYVVVQANPRFREFRVPLEAILALHPNVAIVILPICWCHGDRAELLDLPGDKTVRVRDWLPPLLIAEIIARSRLAIGSSLHLCITGLAYGVPVVRVPASVTADRKFELLRAFRNWSDIANADRVRSLTAGENREHADVEAAADQLDSHWDSVVAAAAHSSENAVPSPAILRRAATAVCQLAPPVTLKATLPPSRRALDSRRTLAQAKAPQSAALTSSPGQPSVHVRVVRTPTKISGRQVCIFVSYSPDCEIKDYVRYHIEALQRCRFDIVLVLVADRIPKSKLQRSARNLTGFVVRENAGFDFGAWADAFRLFPALWTAERLLLVNDSIFGPAGDFRSFIRKVVDSSADLVGLTESHDVRRHFQSYFLMMNRRMLDDPAVRRFWYEIVNFEGKRDVIEEYETKLTEQCQAWGLTSEALFPIDPSSKAAHLNRTIHDWRQLIRDGFPYIKIELLRDFPWITSAGWQNVITDRRLLAAIEKHLNQAREVRNVA